MFKEKFVLLLMIAAWGLLPQITYADDKEKLGDFPIEALVVRVDPKDDDFQVIYSRMEETTTAAVAFGIIGAAVNSGINGSEDSDRAKKYKVAADSIDLSEIIHAEVISRLEKKEFPLASDIANGSHTLNVEIKEWGLRKVAFDESEVTTFIRMRLTVREGKKLLWEKWHKQSGKEEILLSVYTAEDFAVNMEKLAKKTGRRIANEIIYR